MKPSLMALAILEREVAGCELQIRQFQERKKPVADELRGFFKGLTFALYAIEIQADRIDACDIPIGSCGHSSD